MNRLGALPSGGVFDYGVDRPVRLPAASTNRLSSPRTGDRPDNADNEGKKEGCLLIQKRLICHPSGSSPFSFTSLSLGGEMR
jgi:hypothetical protein